MKDITGKRFGSLVAMQYSHSGKNHMHYWIYQCDCGKEIVARSNTVAYELRKGDPELPSCGCVGLSRKTKHGYRKAKGTHPAYRAYRGMMSRCYDPSNSGYQWYGARGVTVHPAWKGNPEAFVEWSLVNGWAPSLHIDKDILCKAKGISPHIYSPETCQWVPAKVNVATATNRDNYGRHPNVRLSHEDVAEIERQYFSGEKKGPALAKQYGVDNSSIYRLLKEAKARSGVTP